MRSTIAMKTTRCAIGLLAVGVLVLGGCTKGSASKISGRVVYQDQPVSGGDVNFLSREKGTAAIAKLDANGSFSLQDPMEAGTYVVYVTPAAAEPQAPGSRPSGKGTQKASIPLKARDPGTSDLTVTVKSGENSLTIELKD